MKIEIKKTVDVPHDALWAAISDFAGTQNFNPVVEKSVLTGDTTIRAWASSACALFMTATPSSRLSRIGATKAGSPWK